MSHDPSRREIQLLTRLPAAASGGAELFADTGQKLWFPQGACLLVESPLDDVDANANNPKRIPQNSPVLLLPESEVEAVCYAVQMAAGIKRPKRESLLSEDQRSMCGATYAVDVHDLDDGTIQVMYRRPGQTEVRTACFPVGAFAPDERKDPALRDNPPVNDVGGQSITEVGSTSFRVVVPEGYGPGQQLRVDAPVTGPQLLVIIPQGVRPGEQFLVPMPTAPDQAAPQPDEAPTTFRVVVPEGCAPGTQIVVCVPNSDQQLFVVIPPGVEPGQQFLVPMPENAALHASSSAYSSSPRHQRAWAAEGQTPKSRPSLPLVL